MFVVMMPMFVERCCSQRINFKETYLVVESTQILFTRLRFRGQSLQGNSFLKSEC